MRKTLIYLQGFGLLFVLLLCVLYWALVLLVLAFRYPKDAHGYFLNAVSTIQQKIAKLGEQLNRKPK